VIAATNIDIDRLRRQKKFRDDFYYRLCSDCIVVPDLQERIRENPNELNEMIAHTVRTITGQDSEELIEIVRDVIDKRLGPDYQWPGNVRELAQCVRRVIIKRDYQPTIKHSPPQAQPGLNESIESGTLDAQQVLTQYCTALYRKHKTFEKVAQITKLDRRTVKKYIQSNDT
jgi:transcriptional regulator with GAF, ATPase, and Fis domain